MYEGPTRTKFGQIAVAEPLRFDLLEIHDGSPLKEVTHAIPIPVLDQEDLHAQGIDEFEIVSNRGKSSAENLKVK